MTFIILCLPLRVQKLVCGFLSVVRPQKRASANAEEKGSQTFSLPTNFSFSPSIEMREMFSLALYWSIKHQRRQYLSGSCSAGFSFGWAFNLKLSSQLSRYGKHKFHAVSVLCRTEIVRYKTSYNIHSLAVWSTLTIHRLRTLASCTKQHVMHAE